MLASLNVFREIGRYDKIFLMALSFYIDEHLTSVCKYVRISL